MKQLSVFLTIILIFISGLVLKAQQGIVTAGGVAIGCGGTLSYSIGQADYLVFSSTAGSMNFGLQHTWDAGGFEVPDINEVQNETIAMNDVMCYDATQTVILAGDGTYFTVEDGGYVEIIAGENILFRDGSVIESGGHLHAWITMDETYCSNTETILTAAYEEIEINAEMMVLEEAFFIIYPNPGSGTFTLEFLVDIEAVNMRIEIYSMQGKLIYKDEGPASGKQEFSLKNYQPGFYILHAIVGEKTGVGKVILRQ